MRMLLLLFALRCSAPIPKSSQEEVASIVEDHGKLASTIFVVNRIVALRRSAPAEMRDINEFCECQDPECDHKPGECSRDLKNGAATGAASTPLNEQYEKGRYLCGTCRQRTDEFMQEDWQTPRQL